jgi:hypothetical protein
LTLSLLPWETATLKTNINDKMYTEDPPASCVGCRAT